MQMRKGQCYHLDVLPRYAYGDKGNADFGIPPGAELEYQVELHQFEKVCVCVCVCVCEHLQIVNFNTACIHTYHYYRR